MQIGLKLFKRAMARMVNGLEVLESVTIIMSDDNLYVSEFL